MTEMRTLDISTRISGMLLVTDCKGQHLELYLRNYLITFMCLCNVLSKESSVHTSKPTGAVTIALLHYMDYLYGSFRFKIYGIVLL